MPFRSLPVRRRALLPLTLAVTGAALLAGPASASAAQRHHFGPALLPGNLLVSRSVYADHPGAIVPGSTVLPPGCTSGCVTATADAGYPEVWNNVLADPSFGITSRIYLDQLTPSGRQLSTLAVPDGPGLGMSTSFSSKSELALNQSLSGRQVTFMGYATTPDTIDASNSSTPGAVDPTDPVPSSYYRVVAQLDSRGRFRFTNTSAYSGNNGRAAILNDTRGANVIYTSGNAGNGSNPQPDGIISGTGAQILTPARRPQFRQQVPAATPVGSFSVTQLGDKAGKVGKDTNFRGMTIFNNVVYYTKGSGSNGVNTVYFVDTTGTACPSGTGLPAPGAPLPASPIAYDPSLLHIWGITSTVSGDGDQGADPNKLVVVTDRVSALTAPAGERFTTMRTAADREVLRGVSFTPGTPASGR